VNGLTDRVVTGVVLVGGRGRRLGRDKALVEIGGVPMVRRVASALFAGGCDAVVLVGHPRPDPAFDGFDVVPDDHPDAGPLGGVRTAQRHLGGDLLVAACDLPDLDAVTVRALLAADPTAEVAVAVTPDGRRHPTLARWSERSTPTVAEVFAAGERALRAALDRLVVVEVACEPGPLRNVNLPSDLDDR
jgi:molybdopterin-guanine dinucleotide biosynthesis protein A